MRYQDLPPGLAVLSLVLHLGLGFGLGTLHFRALWWQAQRLALPGRRRLIVLALVGRFVVLGAVMVFAALEGALPLLVTALGLLIARAVVMRRLKERLP